MLRTVLLAASLSLVSCAADLQVCQFDAAADLAYSLPPNQCPPEPNPCYQDFDGDGYGSPENPVFLREAGANCGEPGEDFRLYSGDPNDPQECEIDDEDGVYHPEGCYRLTPLGQDCDDGDDLRFPGNPEICDGLDNDCDEEEEPDFDDEGEEEVDGDPAMFSCTPYETVRFFLRGGSHINGEALNASKTEIVVNGGDPLEGVIKLRVFEPYLVQGEVSGGLSVSLPDGAEEGYFGYFDPADLDTQAFTSVYDLEIILDGTREAPLELPEDREVVHATLAAVFGREPELLGFDGPDLLEQGGVSPEHLAALSSPWYCQDALNPGPQSCPPIFAEPPDEDDEFVDFDRDLASLDALELASCRVHGSARFPFLVESINFDGDACRLDEPVEGPGPGPGPGGDCLPLYSNIPVGCMTFGIRVEGGEE